MAVINRPEVAAIIKDMTNDKLELVGEAYTAFECEGVDCSSCPFNYCDHFIQDGYVGCILADAVTELSIREQGGEG